MIPLGREELAEYEGVFRQDGAVDAEEGLAALKDDVAIVQVEGGVVYKELRIKLAAGALAIWRSVAKGAGRHVGRDLQG